MELEEAIQTLKDFAKYGRYYSNNTEHHMKTAINTVLNHITKQEKMIKLMVEKYNDDFGDIGDFCQHEYCSKDYNCKECIKQYFEKKVEEES